jgi:hypothetical protein
MRTFLFRYEIGQQRGLARVDAKCEKAAMAWAKLLVERKSGGHGYVLWHINR